MNKEKRKKKRKERARELRRQKVGIKRHAKIPKFITKIDGEGNKTKVLNPDWYEMES